MKNNIKLIIGIALPILVILFVIGSVAIPKLFFNPKYDFLYTVGSTCVDNYGCNYYGGNVWSPYKVVSGRVEKETTLPQNAVIPNPVTNIKSVPAQVIYPKIYRYSVVSGAFSEISLEEAQNLQVTDGGSAPDGTVVINGGNNGGLFGELLGGGSYYGLYLKNGGFSRKIIVDNGSNQNYYYNSNFHLIGWIK